MDKRAASDFAETNVMVIVIIAVAIVALIVVMTGILGRS